MMYVIINPCKWIIVIKWYTYVDMIDLQTLTSAWISNHMHSRVWDEIAYPYPTSRAQWLKFGNE